MNRLEIMVLANRHESTRIYLEYLHEHGYLVNHILNITIVPKPKPNDNFLKFKIIGYKRRLQTYFYKFRKKNLYKKLANILQEPFTIRPNHFETINFKKYSQDVKKLEISNMNDPVLYKYLKNHSCKTLFFAASGIISKKILSIPKLKIIHIHPGILPYIRGSDGLLWSLLLRKKIGMSCFYMDSGIDTGKIIKTKEFDLIIPAGLVKFSDDIYYSLLMYYEPHFRAKLLIEIIQKYSNNLNNIATLQQFKQDGINYFSMHPILRNRVVKSNFFPKGR